MIDLIGRAGMWRFCFERGEKFAALDPEIEARVRRRFVPEVEAFEQLIGRDLAAWKGPRDPAQLRESDMAERAARAL